MFANGHTSDPNAKEPILDFFGVSVKAEDVPQQVERMYLLKKKVGAYRHRASCAHTVVHEAFLHAMQISHVFP